MTMNEVNALSETEFLAMFGSVYEHSAWVAEAVVAKRPFPDKAALLDAMDHVVRSASAEEKLKLLRAHPELAGKAAIDGTLTTASQAEQASAGLDRMLREEFQELTTLNTQYTDKFGFPFIICVRMTTKTGILQALRLRLQNSPEQEFSTALDEVKQIAALRVEGILS